jgi:hypothetical protein
LTVNVRALAVAAARAKEIMDAAAFIALSGGVERRVEFYRFDGFQTAVSRWPFIHNFP